VDRSPKEENLYRINTKQVERKREILQNSKEKGRKKGRGAPAPGTRNKKRKKGKGCGERGSEGERVQRS